MVTVGWRWMVRLECRLATSLSHHTHPELFLRLRLLFVRLLVRAFHTRTPYLCTRPIVIVEGPSVATLPSADSCSISRNNRSRMEKIWRGEISINLSCEYYFLSFFFLFLMERACLKIFVREIFKTRRKVCCEKKEEKKEGGEERHRNRVVWLFLLIYEIFFF